MDTQLLIWVLVFVGGYSLVLGYLLRIALRNRGESGTGAPGGADPGGGSGPDPDDRRGPTPPPA